MSKTRMRTAILALSLLLAAAGAAEARWGIRHERCQELLNPLSYYTRDQMREELCKLEHPAGAVTELRCALRYRR